MNKIVLGDSVWLDKAQFDIAPHSTIYILHKNTKKLE